jgi:large subunit ribosomal protein L23
MGIFDKIIGKKSAKDGPASDGEEKAEKVEKKTPEIKTEKKSEPKKEEMKRAEEKPVAKKAKAEKTAKPRKEVKARKVSKKEENIAHKILFENMISEKSTQLAAENKYVFRVAKDAGKFQIKEAVERYYGVQVIGVNTVRIHPKKRIHGRTVGWKKGFKKAVVTLKEGSTITAVEGV